MLEKEPKIKQRMVLCFICLLSMLISVTGCVNNTKKSNEKTTEISEPEVPVNITEEVIDVEGIEEPFEIFFLADSHISLCDNRDMDLTGKAFQRSVLYKTDGIEAHDRFDALINAANTSDAKIVLMGGDIIDSAMYASIDHVRSALSSLDKPYLYSMGNHDFEYGREYFTEKAYNTYLPRLKEFRDGTEYQIRQFDEVTIFTVDDRNNQVAPEVLKAFKKIVSEDKPIVLVVHVPIEPVTGSSQLLKRCEEEYGVPRDKIRLFIGKNGCLPDSVTREFIDLVLGDESPVVLVLAGHVHFYHREMLNNKTLQIITGPAFAGQALDIKLK
ncbi:MAG: metallophosphoesterase [Lachnospiraceae bacterium]|nr:metallophosphoesterase [Lachnospiraceae bacterium]